MRTITLASRSPRRKSLLESAGFIVDVKKPSTDETRREGEDATSMVERLARDKAFAVEAEGLVVAADTAVVLQGKILGKPLDENDARKILASLSGEEHQVLTGFCVRKGGEERLGVVATQVWFRQLNDAEITNYIKSGEPMDKAGAYGIQGIGGFLVDRVSGSYTNVVGLPLREVLWELEDLR